MSRREPSTPPHQTVDQLLEVFGNRDSDMDAREHAAVQLGGLTDERAVAALVNILRSEQGDIRFLAADALARVGEGDSRALRPLLQLEGDAGKTSGGAKVADAVATAIRSLRGTSQATRDPWVLVSNRQYNAAIAAYSHRYEEDRSASHLRNRGLLHLFAGDFQAALRDFSQVRESIRPELQDDAIYLVEGVCYWYLNQPGLALAAWESSLSAPYSDAAGGVEGPAILLYAGERLRDVTVQRKALGLLSGVAESSSAHWPGCIAPFLLGRMSIGDFEEQVHSTDSTSLQVRRQCQADFYAALRALREGDESVYKARMSKCAKTETLLETEFYLARWEVRNGFPAIPFDALA